MEKTKMNSNDSWRKKIGRQKDWIFGPQELANHKNLTSCSSKNLWHLLVIVHSMMIYFVHCQPWCYSAATDWASTIEKWPYDGVAAETIERFPCFFGSIFGTTLPLLVTTVTPKVPACTTVACRVWTTETSSWNEKLFYSFLCREAKSEKTVLDNRGRTAKSFWKPNHWEQRIHPSNRRWNQSESRRRETHSKLFEYTEGKI